MVKVDVTIKKISQGNKMWLEWFPFLALLNLPNPVLSRIDIIGGTPKSTDPPLRIHDNVPTGSSGHTTVGDIMEPQWLPI